VAEVLFQLVLVGFDQPRQRVRWQRQRLLQRRAAGIQHHARAQLAQLAGVVRPAAVVHAGGQAAGQDCQAVLFDVLIQQQLQLS